MVPWDQQCQWFSGMRYSNRFFVIKFTYMQCKESNCEICMFICTFSTIPSTQYPNQLVYVTHVRYVFIWWSFNSYSLQFYFSRQHISVLNIMWSIMNPLGPADVLWRDQTGWTLFHVMDGRPLARNHCVDWLIYCQYFFSKIKRKHV